MSGFLTDLRYATRSLARTPGFTAIAVATLALGIGANTAIFSVVDGVLLRPTPFADPDRLVMVWETDRKSGTTREPASVPDFLDFRERSEQLQRLSAFTALELSLNHPGSEPTRLAALAVGHDLLPMVGIAPLVGRTFTADEDRPGGPAVVLISEALWERLFGRDPAVVGRGIMVDDARATVVGVLPAGADFGTLQVLGAAAYGRGFAERGGQTRVDLWVPLQPDPVSLPRQTHPILVVGRLAQGASASQAQQEMTTIMADLERAYPENDARGAFVESMPSVVFGPVRPALLLLLGAVVLVLLVTCVNVANFLLARGTSRMHDVTVRVALGASGWRLARQFLAESTLLTVAGGAAGVALAYLLLDVLVALAPATIPRVGGVGIDARVLLGTVLVTAVVALVFGLLPMLQARRYGLASALRDDPGRGATAGRAQGRLRSVLVVAELAMAVMLMVGAGLLINSLWRLRQVNPGFRAEHVLKAEYQLPGSRYPQRGPEWPRWLEVQRFAADLRQRVSVLPGVSSVTIAGSHPLDPAFTSSIVVAGREAEAADWPEPSIRRIDPGYLATLGVPLRAGRDLTGSDDAEAPPVVLINEAARQRFFAERDPLGHRIRLWGAERTVVGVIGNEKIHGLARVTPPSVYLPLTQAPAAGGSLLVRAEGDPVTLATAIGAIVRDLDPALPLFGVEPLATTLSNSTGQQRFTTIVLGLFAAVALLLAVAGVHGLLSYMVARRTREIGIRMALGADAPAVRALVLTAGGRLMLAGLGLGILGALAVSRVLTALLYGVTPDDPATLAGVAVVLGIVAVTACYVPAHRAARVDPMVALRAE
jgi:putative ABC transport system permease protein